MIPCLFPLRSYHIVLSCVLELHFLSIFDFDLLNVCVEYSYVYNRILCNALYSDCLTLITSLPSVSTRSHIDGFYTIE